MIINKIFQTPNDDHFFFGYHDTSQLSPDDKHIIAIKIDNISVIPTSNIIYEIYLFNIFNGSSTKISDTRTINFQQGSRLHWLNNDEFITNDFDGSKYFSKVINIHSGKISKKFSHPIYCISNNKKFALTVDFERLFWVRRGYSYDAIINNSKNTKIYNNETISLIDLESGKINHLFNIQDVIKISFVKTMNNAIHYLEHLSISPDDNKFIFLHRFKLEDGGIFSRMLKYDLKKNTLSLLLNSGRVSHFAWRSNNQLIFYGSFGNMFTAFRKKSSLKKIFKKLLYFYKFFIKDNTYISKLATGDGYKIIDTENNKKIHINIEKLNREDGHPTCYNEEIFVTDNYPDNDNQNKASLFKVDLNSNFFSKLTDLDSIKEFDNTPIRCDLHPRFSNSKNYLSIDCMENNHRSCIVFKLFE